FSPRRRSVHLDVSLSARSALSLHDALPILPGDLGGIEEHVAEQPVLRRVGHHPADEVTVDRPSTRAAGVGGEAALPPHVHREHRDRKSTRLNSSHVSISYAVFCLKKKTDSY